jgi:hypothetical protein
VSKALLLATRERFKGDGARWSSDGEGKFGESFWVSKPGCDAEDEIGAMVKDGTDGRESDLVRVTLRVASAGAVGVCVTAGPPKTASSPEKPLALLLSPSVSLSEASRSIETRFEGGGKVDSSTRACGSK